MRTVWGASSSYPDVEVHEIHPGLALCVVDGDRAILGAGKLRKNTACAACREPLVKGTLAYASPGNQSWRSYRWCVRCIEGTSSS